MHRKNTCHGSGDAYCQRSVCTELFYGLPLRVEVHVSVGRCRGFFMPARPRVQSSMPGKRRLGKTMLCVVRTTTPSLKCTLKRSP